MSNAGKEMTSPSVGATRKNMYLCKCSPESYFSIFVKLNYIGKPNRSVLHVQ